MEKDYYLFNPIQFQEFGYQFYKGTGFYYRYQLSKKLFRKHTYIPFGPNCETKEDFISFLNHVDKIGKVTIDLPMIYCEKTKKEIIDMLKNKGFKNIPYVHQDEETIIINKSDFKINSRIRNKINHGNRVSNIIIKEKLTEEELKELYNIYLISSKRINFNPKNIDVFKKMLESSLISLCYKENKMIGFVFGYIFQSCSKKIFMVMFTAQTEEGKKNRIGHAMHYNLFEKAFESVDLIDFHGASRTKNRPYVSFKEEFSSNFCELPGSFKKS